MRITVETLTREALALPAEARCLLVDQLVASLDPLLEEDLRAVWAAEALRRLDEIRTKKVKAVPLSVALARVRKSIGE